MPRQLMHIEDPPRPRPPERAFALWELGFRPFYLLASMFAAVSIALWGLQLAGWVSYPYLAGPLWHAHEMVFGFVLAVVVGFLLTAGRNWAGLPATSPTTLKLLVLLWVAGRVLVLTPLHVAAAVATTAFPLAAAAALAGPLTKSRNRRNYFFVGLLVLLSFADLSTQLGVLGISDLPASWGIQLALDIILLVMAVMAGRVIPMFTNNGVRGAHATRNPWLERIALGSVLALLVADVAEAPASVIASIAATAALAHLARWTLWQPWTTLRVPLVWILHAAYLWIPIHLLLRAAASSGWVIPGLATHALTVGAIGGLTIDMMTRTARGHTARPLKADGFEVTCYAAVLCAAVVRVFGPLIFPGAYMTCALAAAMLWCCGFALYAFRYWPILTRARLDGRPG
jgi:uncharacterized protein involved in response to NO